MAKRRDDIDSRTRLVALLGHPVGHSFSPLMHNAAFEEAGLNLAYLAFDVHPDRLKEAVGGLRALRFAGANLTIPHKEAVIPLLDSLDPAARRIGAVNTIVLTEDGLRGYNTDALGFLSSLESAWGRGPADTRCLVLGAGGAARAVVASLMQAGAAEVLVYNRTRERARLLCEEAETWGAGSCRPVDGKEASDAVSSAILVVNATPWGQDPGVKLTEVSVDSVKEGQVLVDLVYGPEQTAFQALGREKGAITIDGTEMLVQQAARSFELWTGVPAPVQAMRSRVTG